MSTLAPSNMSPTLDAPDPQLQAIQMKLFQGRPLSKQEQQRWANRIANEKEVARLGGTAKGTVLPPTPRAAGQAETREAMEYLQGRDDVLKPAGAPAATPGSGPAAGPSGEPTNPYGFRAGGSSLERTRTDGMAIGLDGKPYNPRGGAVTDRGPAVADRINKNGTAGFQMAPPVSPMSNPAAVRPPRFPELTNEDRARGMTASPEAVPGVPEGYGFVGGPGNFMISGPEGMVTGPDGKRRKFASEDEVMGYFSELSPTTAPAAQRSIQEEEDFIRSKGYGDFVDRARSGATVEDVQLTPAPLPPARRSPPNMNAQAQAWFGQGGMMPSAASAPRVPPGLPSAEAVQRSQGADLSGVRGMIQASLTTPVSSSVRDAFKPVPRDTGMVGTTYNPASGTPVPGWAQNAMPQPAPAPATATAQPAAPAAPMFPNAIWNTGIVPKGGQAKPYQDAADRYNPFAPTLNRPRRTTSIIPE